MAKIRIGDATGHIVELVDGKYVYQHRLIWEKVNGPIPEGMIIHHINENPSDNRIENLQMMTHAEHAKHHQIKSNSFKGKKHSEDYKSKRSLKYRGAGNPRYKSSVSDELIKNLRHQGLTWVQIQNVTGLDRKSCRKRLEVCHRMD